MCFCLCVGSSIVCICSVKWNLGIVDALGGGRGGLGVLSTVERLSLSQRLLMDTLEVSVFSIVTRTTLLPLSVCPLSMDPLYYSTNSSQLPIYLSSSAYLQ